MKSKRPKKIAQNQINKKGKVFAYGCCDLGGYIWDDSRSRYVLRQDLYTEPTARRLEYTSEEYVPFLVNSNNLLDELYSILNTSPTNNAIVQQKTCLTQGDGFIIEEGRQSILTKLKGAIQAITGSLDSAKESLSNFLHEVNPEGETMQDILNKAAFELWGYGNAFIELIKAEVNQDGERTRAFYIRHIPIHMCRPKKVTDNSRVVKFIGVSDGWIVKENNPPDVVDYPVYPTFGPVGNLESERSIIHLKNYRSQFFYWGVPDYIAGTLWGEMEYRIPKFNQAKFDNGFTPSAIIQLQGDYSQDQANNLVDKFQDYFTGTGNNSKMFFSVVNDVNAEQKVDVLQQTMEGEFRDLANIARQQIVTAHRWTMALAGMGVAGQLGSNQQIAAEFSILNSTVISPIQKMFEAKFINKAIQEANAWLGENWSELSVTIASKTPISFIGALPVENILTTNEQRQILGYQPLENADQNNM